MTVRHQLYPHVCADMAGRATARLGLSKLRDPFLMALWGSHELQSKVPKGGYMRDYMGDYYRGY